VIRGIAGLADSTVRKKSTMPLIWKALFGAIPKMGVGWQLLQSISSAEWVKGGKPWQQPQSRVTGLTGKGTFQGRGGPGYPNPAVRRVFGGVWPLLWQ